MAVRQHARISLKKLAQLTPGSRRRQTAGELSKDDVQSVRVDPVRVPRAKKHKRSDGSDSSHDEPNLPAPVKFIKIVKVTDGSFEIIKRPGAVAIIGFDSAAPIEL